MNEKNKLSKVYSENSEGIKSLSRINIKNKADALVAIRFGMFMAYFQGILSLIIFLIVFGGYVNDEGILEEFNDPFFLFDIALLFFLGYILNKTKHIAAGAALFIISLVNIFLAFNLLKVFISYVYFKAFRATLTLKKISQTENLNNRQSRWPYYIAFPMLIIIMLGYGMESGYFPNTSVQSGNSLPIKIENSLIKNKLITNDEDIAYIYSSGMFSYLGEGSILTNRNLILYGTDEFGSRFVWRIPLNEISSINNISEGDYLTDSEWKAGTKEYVYSFSLSAENKRDQLFISSLKTNCSKC